MRGWRTKRRAPGRFLNRRNDTPVAAPFWDGTTRDKPLAHGGRIPVNPSGGLIGGGHPVGATGVRMLLDAARQVTGRAGDYQVEGARRFGTLNIGGSTTTTVSFVVGAE